MFLVEEHKNEESTEVRLGLHSFLLHNVSNKVLYVLSVTIQLSANADAPPSRRPEPTRRRRKRPLTVQGEVSRSKKAYRDRLAKKNVLKNTRNLPSV